MGQKVNPKLFRLGPVFTWSSLWFDDKNFKNVLLQDYKLRKYLFERLKMAGVSEVKIERAINSIKIIIYVSRPGLVIGRAGTGLEELKKNLQDFLFKEKNKTSVPKLEIKVEPIKEPNLDPYLVAKNIADQLTKRMPYKRILAQNSERVMSSGAKGVRIIITGRIGGAEIGRREKIQTGRVPLSTIRENICFASYPALTKKGYVGVKVWINKPEGK